ncbi:hypothetical protein IPG41_04510 [Candidatus Peregrinibacteria bacterium]|nr:MAG: hypothetical protein IPG41_04510 [Candidatus Peregrinibacteria bacterium]
MSSNKTANGLIEALQAGDSQKILAALHNDFQVFYTSPKLKPGEHAILTGSGSAFAVVTSRF